MGMDLSRLSEAELVELNRRVVERLEVVRAARDGNEWTRFTVGMVVDFTDDEGQQRRGAIARLDREAATILSQAGSWRVPPSRIHMPLSANAPGAAVIPGNFARP